ncbi:MAG: succinate dehydrogenase / fumarate reductase membrane anchor subunit [Porticoccaceae bacterium]|jgi:succinate dehydrogenase / fumarate reductase membrane anchor subunit|nr:succinate dehydrogenase, hydrophobic membrane anchor protein [SAR92 clade bacterium]|tara:strand:- start:8755 stop:9123 length:369 start_codon:yes stop_codon:yes gene_type:complete
MMAFFARFTLTGPSNWIIQRITAIVMAAYLFFIVGFLVINPALTYDQWSALNGLLSMRIFTLVTIAAVAFHAWIGMRCVLTDYITVRLIGPKANGVRNVLQLGLGFIILLYLMWTIKILWGL